MESGLSKRKFDFSKLEKELGNGSCLDFCDLKFILESENKKVLECSLDIRFAK